MRDAVIRIKTVQREGGEASETEVITAGSFRSIPSGYEMSYDETDATGYDGCKTVLKVLDGSKIELERTGPFTSELYIELGRKNFCSYGTPFGALTVGVLAKKVESNLTDSGGTARASYVIDVNSTLIGDYDIEIDVKCS